MQLGYGNRVDFYSDADCTQKLELFDQSQFGQEGVDMIDQDTQYMAYFGLSQFQCVNDKKMPFSLFAECRTNTFSMNLAIDCDSKNRWADKSPIDPIDRLEYSEKQEYYFMRCVDPESRLKLDMTKYLTGGKCTKCC